MKMMQQENKVEQITPLKVLDSVQSLQENKKLNLQYLLHLKSGFDARRNCLRFKNNVEINRIRALYADDHGDRRIEELSEY
ncbi:9280_t:CDS:2 [Rhizophagus irregularis]|nr:9280_t:CDS:2 [Rhizophagus irregularis]